MTEMIVIKVEPLDYPLEYTGEDEDMTSKFSVEPSNKEPQASQPEFVNIKSEPVDEIRIKVEEYISPDYSQPVIQDLQNIDNGSGDTIYKVSTNGARIDEILNLIDNDSPVDDDQPKFEDGSTEEFMAQPNAIKNERDTQEVTAQSYSIINGEFHCTICLKRFASKSNIFRHLAIHTREQITCDICGRNYTNHLMYQRHRAQHSNERVFSCDECGKSFKTTSNLAQHKKSHAKPFTCRLCDKTFSVKANLMKHEGKSRCKKKDPLVCLDCGKVFDQVFLYKSHLKKHSDERPFKCDICNMGFKQKSAITRHIQGHLGTKPYLCKYCPKSFTHYALLKPHIRIHTGEKPYVCPICTKTFTHKHNMQRHALRHNVVKHLKCNVCHKLFPTESRLRYHMKVHLDTEKPFPCLICPKRFSHRQNIVRHYRRKHPNATYDCKDTDASIAWQIWETVMEPKFNEDLRADEILP